MQITRSSIATRTGPRDWFTGGVYVDTITAQPRRRGCRPQAFSSRRAPGPPWHTHPVGQTIYVLELVGRCQRRGGPVEVIGPGDRVFFEPGEDHWHGAAPDRFMTHLAMLEVDENGDSVNWGEHVTDEQYSATPAGT